MTTDALRAGAARLSLDPPLDLPLVGFVRQVGDATGYGRFGLETSAVALEQDGLRVVVCGVDIVGIGEPEISALLDRVAAATGADPDAILLNWNHTHLSVIGGFWGGELTGPSEPERDARIRAFADVIQDLVVSVCRLACERLEPARPVWGVGEAELAVNRRERAPDGTTILGWNPDELVDNQVVSLQVRRPDETAIATVMGYGCHPVTTGYDMLVYSADFPGPMRDVVRTVTGGEAVFFQGAGGNVLPKVAFTDSEDEAEAMGGRLGLEALHSLAGRFAYPRRMTYRPERSIMQISSYRREAIDTAPRRSPRRCGACAFRSCRCLRWRRYGPYGTSGRRSWRRRSPRARGTAAPPASPGGTSAGRARRSRRCSMAPRRRFARGASTRSGSATASSCPGRARCSARSGWP